MSILKRLLLGFVSPLLLVGHAVSTSLAQQGPQEVTFSGRVLDGRACAGGRGLLAEDGLADRSSCRGEPHHGGEDIGRRIVPLQNRGRRGLYDPGQETGTVLELAELECR